MISALTIACVVILALTMRHPQRDHGFRSDQQTQPTNPINWSQVRQDDPLNLSISVSGGKENNNDSPSSGERSGNSSKLKSRRAAVANCSLWTAIEGGRGVKSAGKQRQRG